MTIQQRRFRNKIKPTATSLFLCESGLVVIIPATYFFLDGLFVLFPVTFRVLDQQILREEGKQKGSGVDSIFS